MSITIKSCKNYKKIAKEVKKILKQQLQSKPNSLIGMEWKDEFLKVTNNLKKILKLDWFSSYIFPLATYLEKQNNQLDKDLVENFVNKINIPFSHYEDIHKLAVKYYLENRVNDLFLFDSQGGVDLLIFFIDSRGNFVFNDYESKKTYLNKANNGMELVSIGIKSILNAKKIICFCTEEASKDVIFKLNKKVIDVDDVLTYLHLHNDVTLFTLNEIINKHEINNDPMTQDKFQFIRELDNADENIDLSEIVDKQNKIENELENTSSNNIENIDLDDFNKNKDNLDEQLLETLHEEQESVDLIEGENDNLPFEEEIKEEDLFEDELQPSEFVEETEEQLDEELEQELVDDEVDHLKDEVEYKSDYIYLEPNQFDFDKSTETADKKHQELLKKQIEELKEKLEKIEQEKQAILERAYSESLENKLEQEALEIESNVKDELDDTNLLLNDDEDLDEIDSLLNGDNDDLDEIDSLLSDDEHFENLVINSNLEIAEDDLALVDITSGLEEESNKVEEEPYDPTKHIGEDLPNNKDDIFRYIQIKSDTLSHVEKLLLNNKLAKMKYDLIQKHLENNENNIDKKIANHTAIKFIDENRHLIDKSSNFNLEKYKLIYLSGFRPVPMLMVWHDINKNFYNSIVKEMKENLNIEFKNDVFDEQVQHVWNDGCYLIYDESTFMIRALAFSSLDRLIFLLRYVNKNLWMQFNDEKIYNILLDLFQEHTEEIKVERI
ncbi:hypothetical protein D8X55_04895 [Malacoplasma penetrans]|uniref:Uncharacterized protein n=1 Tax=Malacoplasma penetrans (strain HF-2) TaxID=272633 RepID=Q8EUH4_MALP2|nr:hypothetical protein [Malacoplasma penetrans]RXY96045.1 hypothetical protein D8X55_04895 [Malacoplasma penetrans]BAC44739.1 hypothetical protein [Malacoplasma penetrans HF-2]